MLSLVEIVSLTTQVKKYVYIIMVCELAIGLVGNTLACLVILCSKSFKNLTGYYLLSLSLADILFLLTNVSYYVFAYKVK